MRRPFARPLIGRRHLLLAVLFAVLGAAGCRRNSGAPVSWEINSRDASLCPRPDGGVIFVAHHPDEKYKQMLTNLFRMSPDGEVVQLTALRRFCVKSLSTSADGATLAFQVTNRRTGRCGVCRIAILGSGDSGLRLLPIISDEKFRRVDPGIGDISPCLAPDASRVVYTRKACYSVAWMPFWGREYSSDYFPMVAGLSDGALPRQFNDKFNNWCDGPIVTPDGRSAALIGMLEADVKGRIDVEKYGLFFIRLDSGSIFKSTKPFHGDNLAFSPNGRDMAYTPPDEHTILVSDCDGGGRRVVCDAGEDKYRWFGSLAFSHDGRSLLFAERGVFGNPDDGTEKDTEEICQLDLETGARKELVPRWSSMVRSDKCLTDDDVLAALKRAGEVEQRFREGGAGAP